MSNKGNPIETVLISVVEFMSVAEDVGLSNLPSGGKLILIVDVLPDNSELMTLMKANPILARIKFVWEERERKNQLLFGANRKSLDNLFSNGK